MTANAPAKAITEFLKKNKNAEKPLFKGAFVEESVYSADQLAILEQLKSKEELIGDIITLLQSPAKNVISGLQSGGRYACWSNEDFRRTCSIISTHSFSK